MTSQALNQTRDLTVQETCGILRVTPPTIYKLLAKGQLESYLVGSARRITSESVTRLRSGQSDRLGSAAQKNPDSTT